MEMKIEFPLPNDSNKTNKQLAQSMQNVVPVEFDTIVVQRRGTSSSLRRSAPASGDQGVSQEEVMAKLHLLKHESE